MTSFSNVMNPCGEHKISGAEIFLETLAKKRIKHIFGVPGREAEAILFNEHPDINIVLTAIENTAGFEAFTYAQVTGKTQVIFATLGPGIANMANVIYSAIADRVPLIFISAQVETDRNFPNHTHQCIDAVAMCRSVTKYAHEVKDVREIKTCLETAFEITQQEPKGPALISIPIDLLKAKIDYSAVSNNVIPIKPNSQKLIEINKAANLISNCKQPLLYVGNEVIRANCVEEVRDLCEKYQIPVISAYDTKGVLPSNHELNYFTCTTYAQGILGVNPNHYLFPKELNCVISLGYDYKDDVLPDIHFRHGDTGKHRLLINFGGYMPTEISKQFDLNIEGDLKTNLRKLLQCLKDRQVNFHHPYDISPLREIIKNRLEPANLESPKGLINMINVMKSINKHSPVLAVDVGTFRHYAVLFSEISQPNRFLTSAGSSSFGTGLPLGFGAALAYKSQGHENEKIIVLAGDGGFNSGIGDLRTLKNHNIDIVIIVLNNNANGLINIYQRKGHDGKTNKDAVEHSKADFVAIAKGYGCNGVKVNDFLELDDFIKEAFDRGGTWVIEVPVYYPQEDIERLTCSHIKLG